MNVSFLLNMTRQDFRDRYAGSVVGVAWAVINPLIMILLYLIIFSEIMGAKLPGNSSLDSFSTYLISGLLPWFAFSNTFLRTTTVFQDKKHIVSKVRVNLYIFPAYIVLSESLTFAVSISLFILLYNTFLNGSLSLILLVFILLVFFLQQIFALAIGLMFSIFNVFFRDIKEFVTIFLNIWFWFTPIIWVPSIAPIWLQKIQEVFNPAYWFISSYQNIFVYGKTPELSHLMLLILCFLFFATISLLLLNFFEREVRDGI
ncbi:MAG: ABC transporter permease [Betaproteobacteria bacterium TMED82]|nr:MAG: ABC transporter permease [Betaproteobacteria bacterium TMED82]|tara:strand:+ start:19090 stop:19866 length:777 start_codon:yes stop_codon:yes gene_type:complete